MIRRAILQGAGIENSRNLCRPCLVHRLPDQDFDFRAQGQFGFSNDPVSHFVVVRTERRAISGDHIRSRMNIHTYFCLGTPSPCPAFFIVERASSMTPFLSVSGKRTWIDSQEESQLVFERGNQALVRRQLRVKRNFEA